MEGLTGVDAHIGGEELHILCFNSIEARLLEWSCGYHIRMDHTTLRAEAKYAPIAGYARKMQKIEVKKEDAIWDFFLTKRGRAKEPTFNAGHDLELHICLEQEDYYKALEYHESGRPPSDDANVSKISPVWRLHYNCGSSRTWTPTC